MNIIRAATRALEEPVRSVKEDINDISCTTPVWIQYKEHKSVFDIAQKKMFPHPSYFNIYKSTLDEFIEIARTSEDPETLMDLYKKMWKIMFDFFSSKEYLASYNPIILHTKRGEDREERISELFDIKQIDLEKDFYEIVLHLVHKQLVSEKYGNLTKLQRIIRIERKWRSFLKDRKG
eukprot:TRINITY_DN349_c0_g1_i3.p1 TRINITY_DN349_c0_g1~~TRINITY_DN349_c0_g1_i3.p1  ORF type:complete len:178 (-),score=36.01 TRINITY_DN349_c0_g1_i3:208-741(-)